MPERSAGLSWTGRTVVDSDGAEIGVCSAVLTDDGTGVPEWLYVRLDGSTVIVPLVDAQEAGEQVRVAVRRADVESAPPPAGDTQHLSQGEEAALYRHYGIEYSRAVSETVLPADAAPADEDNRPTSSPAAGRARGVAAAAVAGLALVLAVVLALRRRRRESASERAAAADRAVRTAVRAARGTSVAVAARTTTALAAAAPVASAVGRAVWSWTSTGTRHAARGAGAVAGAAAASLPRLASAGLTGARAVGSAARELGGTVTVVPEVVSETGHRLEKGWRRGMGKLSLGLGFGAGYVFGARAGRARFEQIRQAAVRFTGRPQVQEALAKVRDAAPGPLQGALDGLTGHSSGGAASTPGTVGLSSDADLASGVTMPTGSSAPAQPLAADDLPGNGPAGGGTA